MTITFVHFTNSHQVKCWWQASATLKVEWKTHQGGAVQPSNSYQEHAAPDPDVLADGEGGKRQDRPRERGQNTNHKLKPRKH